MGNWQERVRQTLDAERKESERAQEAHRRWEERAQAIQREEEAKRTEEEDFVREELSALLHRVGVKELLRLIRDEVWKEGDIREKAKEVAHVNRSDEGWGVDEYEIGLFYTYKGAYHDAGSYNEELRGGESGGGYTKVVSYDHGWKIDWLTTSTKVTLERRFSVPEGWRSLDYRRSFEGRPYGLLHTLQVQGIELVSYADSLVNLDPNNPEKSKDKLEALLLKDCVKRTKLGALPSQLEMEGRRMIRKLTIPWPIRILF